jgi:Putative polyhydroxyalkanoic acid system protein (PHA_gran_rgn)
MPGFNMSVAHDLNPEEAVRRLKNVIRELQTQFADKISNVEESWAGNSGKFSFDVMGFSISGTLNVAPKTVELDGKIPMGAMLFKSKIESLIREKMSQLLA